MKELSVKWKHRLCYVTASENFMESEVQQAVELLMMQTMQAWPANIMCMFENFLKSLCDRDDF